MDLPYHPAELASNRDRESVAEVEPHSIRTYTPTLVVIDRSAGVYHWTPEGRRLYDFTSGVLVTNLGHNPESWMKRFTNYMGWRVDTAGESGPVPAGYFSAQPLNAYNAVTHVEVEASRRLVELMRGRPGGGRMEQVLWAASGSEAIQKALWMALAYGQGGASPMHYRMPPASAGVPRRDRDIILATRHGFHGKKGLAHAVTGCETDHDRDPRVRFISFPMDECRDVLMRDQPFDPVPYRKELESLRNEFGLRIGTLITEPYLGGGGSYHPPAAYLQLLQQFCRDNRIVFILDEVQSNFGRTGKMFAYETYGLEPDIVVLGKGLGNGVPVAAAVGRREILGTLDYGEGSDTWSANPLACAGVLATLDEFAANDLLGNCKAASAVIERGLVRLKEFPFVANLRGEDRGMVWGLECRDHGGKSAADWANAIVLACYRSDGQDGIHLLGPLAKKVIRIAPPLSISTAEAAAAMDLMRECIRGI
jgi:4-aminobutyrate aminotransferase-like enzyme